MRAKNLCCKWLKILLLVLMFLLLCAPSFGKLVKLKQVYPIDENRLRAQRPPLSEAWQAFVDTGEYCALFNDWFNDNFQLRDLFIRTKNQIQYALFDVANGIYVGEDDYLYYESVVALEQVLNEKLTEAQLDETEALLIELKDRVEALGAEFYCMFPPHKNTAFPERAESIPINRPSVNQYDRWCERMRTGVFAESFIDVLPVLREAEAVYPTYYKTDFHWNNYGATVAFTEWVNGLAGRTVFSEADYSVVFVDGFQGNQLNNFSVLIPRSEPLLYTVKHTALTMQNDPKASTLQPVSYYWKNTADALLGTALIIGDSYTLYVMHADSGVLDNFSEVYYINMNYEKYEDFLVEVEPGTVDYVLFEKVESNMYKYADMLKKLLGKE